VIRGGPLTVVVPVYQEGGNLPRFWGRLAPWLPPASRVLLVHDRDDDDTLPPARTLQAAGAPIALLRNEGRGARSAILTGLRAVPCGPAVVMMADLSDDPAALPAMLDAYRAGADVVVASRYTRGGSQRGGPWLKGQLARWGGRSLRWLVRFPASDATNSFRLYDAALVRELSPRSGGGLELAFEITLAAWKAGRCVAEVPTRWSGRTAGVSRFQLVRWLPRYAGLWVRALLHGIAGMPRGPAAVERPR
jgi:hypothetical protein